MTPEKLTDRDFIIEQLKAKQPVMKDVHPDLLNDPSFILEAMKYYTYSFTFASKEVRNNKDVAIVALRRDPKLSAHLAADLRYDHELIYEIVKTGQTKPEFIAGYDETIRRDFTLMKRLIELDPRIRHYVILPENFDRLFVEEFSPALYAHLDQLIYKKITPKSSPFDIIFRAQKTKDGLTPKDVQYAVLKGDFKHHLLVYRLFKRDQFQKLNRAIQHGIELHDSAKVRLILERDLVKPEDALLHFPRSFSFRNEEIFNLLQAYSEKHQMTFPMAVARYETKLRRKFQKGAALTKEDKRHMYHIPDEASFFAAALQHDVRLVEYASSRCYYDQDFIRALITHAPTLFHKAQIRGNKTERATFVAELVALNPELFPELPNEYRYNELVIAAKENAEK